MNQQSGATDLQEHIQGLLELQEIDERIAEARQKQRTLPEELAAEHGAYRQAEAALAEAKAQLEVFEKERRTREGELEEQETHLEKLKLRLKEISNTREYQAYIQEMDGVQRNISELEDVILGHLTKIEDASAGIEVLDKEFTEHEVGYKAGQVKVNKELARMEKGVATWTTEKAERADKVDKVLLRRYDRVSRSVRRAIVPVDGHNCAGCHMSIPPQLVAEVKRGNQIHDCPHCHRLLYRPQPVADAAES